MAEITNEQKAHELALLLVQKDLASSATPTGDAEVFALVQDYTNYYESILKALNC